MLGFISDHCGTTDILLRNNEPLTIYSNSSLFAIYPGKSHSIPDIAADDVIVTDISPQARYHECLWRLTEPTGTRIRVEVMEFSGNGLVMKIGNGNDPTNGLPVLALDTSSRIVPLPTGMVSVDSGLWVTLAFANTNGYLKKLRLVITTYHVAGKYFPVGNVPVEIPVLSFITLSCGLK